MINVPIWPTEFNTGIARYVYIEANYSAELDIPIIKCDNVSVQRYF